MSTQLWCYRASQKGSEDEVWDTLVGKWDQRVLVSNPGSLPYGCDQPLKQQAPISLPGQYPVVQMGVGMV